MKIQKNLDNFVNTIHTELMVKYIQKILMCVVYYTEIPAARLEALPTTVGGYI